MVSEAGAGANAESDGLTEAGHGDALVSLIAALRCLPGVGQRSAMRMAYHLLQHDRGGGAQLAAALQTALAQIRHCQRCRTFTEGELCPLCADPKRDARILCVAETPSDLAAIERSGGYRGLYFVLMGRLSPLDGVGPQSIGLDFLLRRAEEPSVQEVVLATNFTAEGETTAHYLSQALQQQRSDLRITRIARGIPIGAELEFTDLGTILHAFEDRHLA